MAESAAVKPALAIVYTPTFLPGHEAGMHKMLAVLSGDAGGDLAVGICTGMLARAGWQTMRKTT